MSTMRSQFQGFRVLFGWLVLILAVTGSGLYAQSVVGVITSQPDTNWTDMVLYSSGGKLFISDTSGARVLVYDKTTLESLGEISLAAYLPARPQSLAIHQDTGTLYVIVDAGYATSASTVVVVDADTHGIVTSLSGIGLSLAMIVDEARDRLYTFGSNASLVDTLTAIDVTTNTVAGSLNIESIMNSGIIGLDPDGGLNPVTGELVLTNLHADEFVVVQGPAMTGSKISATSSRGWCGVWNPQENKIYITTISWGGYFSYDRDTDTAGFSGCVNDGTKLFYSAGMNRVYSGAEIDGNAVVIEGDDSCQEVSIGSGMAAVGFAGTRHHAYFASGGQVKVLDESTLTSLTSFPIPGPSGGGVAGSNVLVDPSTQRAFVLSYRDLTEGERSCVFVVDDLAPIITDHPQSTAIQELETANLSVSAVGTGTLHYQWYQGDRGVTSLPVGTDSDHFTTPPLTGTTRYWVRVSDDLGHGDSNAATVTVDPYPGVWTAQDSGTNEDLHRVFFLNDTTGWVVGDWGTIRKTTNGGATWSSQSSGTNTELFGLAFVNSTTGWVVGYNGLIKKTTDGGASWSIQTSGTDSQLYGIAFTDSNTGWAVGASGTILHTADGGNTWGPQGSGIYDWLYDVRFVDALTGWTVGYGGAVYRTTDGGTTWTPEESDSIANLYAVDFINSSSGWVVGDFGSIFESDDGGDEWTAEESGVEEELRGLDFVTDLRGWAVGAGGRILKSVDGGAAWFPQSSGVPSGLNDVYFVNVNEGWAVGDGGLILRHAPVPPTLTVAIDGTGNGSVTSSPAGIICGADCSESYSWETVVTLSAAPDGWSVFGGWTGACSGTGTCEVTMDQARAVTATFNAIGTVDVFFTGPDRGLYLMRTDRDATVAAVSAVPGGGTSSHGAAIAVFQDRQYMAIKADGNSSIWIKSRARYRSFADSSWMQIPGGTSSSPALCVFNDRLYLFVKASSNSSLFYRSMDNSSVWTAWSQVPGSNTLWSPGLVVLGNRLYCFESDATSNRLWYKSMDESGTWGEWFMIPTGSTNAAPTPVVRDGKIWLFVKGLAGKLLWWSATTTPDMASSWSPWTSCSGSSEAAPGVAFDPAENVFHLVVRGNMVPRIWHRTFDPATLAWSNWHLLTNLDAAAQSIDAPAVLAVGW